jgi:chromosome partitioning protein
MLTTAQAAAMMGISTGTVTYYIRKGMLPASETPGGHYRIAAADVDAFLSRLSHPQEEGARIVAFTNQKGGVGKTTLTVNMGVLLWQLGLRVLIVDLDAQGHATFTLGLNPDACDYTIYDAMLNERSADLGRLIRVTPFGPDLAPINIVATNADRDLIRNPTWGKCLATVLDSIRTRYDYILLDTGPSLTALTITAFCAADYVVIPTQLEMLSVRGLQLLLERIDEARATANPSLQIAGAVAMMVQSIHADRTMAEALRAALGQRGIHAFGTGIKRSAQFKEVANNRGIMVATHPRSEHSAAYRAVLTEILKVVGGPGLDRVARWEAEAAASEPGEPAAREAGV